MKVKSIDSSKVKKANFTYNWNKKLYCPSFSFIRLESEHWKVGTDYEITLKDAFITLSRCVHISTFTLEKLTLPMALLDTGYNIEETKAIIKKMYSNVSNWEKQNLYWIVVDELQVEKGTKLIDTKPNKQNN